MKNIIKKILKPAAPALLSVCIAAGALAGCAAPERSSDSGSNNKSDNSAKKERAERDGQHQKSGAEAGWPKGENGANITDDYYNQEPYNTEEYTAINENSFMSVSANPLSTFAADVDTASYSIVRKKINEGIVPDIDSVRIEEMLNYFTYDYPQPKEGEPFSVTTEITDCPWNKDSKLMLIGLQAQKVDLSEAKPSNLVFLIDVSGSMEEPDKLPLVKRAFGLLVEQLKKEDKVSIVTYASGDEVVLRGADGADKNTIKTAIDELAAGGSTAGAKGIETAYEIAEKNFIEGGNNRIILATDGDLNVGITSEGELKKLIKKKKEGGVFLSVLGFGHGNIKDNKLQALADNGNGNYSYIDSIYEARKVLVSELGGTCHAVAKDVKLQLEFNPYNVKGYRLIGYESRVMAAEDFDDDKKDGGEIGSGHRVTVLYEIVTTDSPMEIGGDLKYQDKTDNTKEAAADELATVSIRYKNPDEAASSLLEYPVKKDLIKDQMSDNMSFAAGVAELGMLLRHSEYAGSSSYDSVLELLGNVRESDDSRDEPKMLVKKLKQIDVREN